MNTFPIIETERLILREATCKDADDMYSYLSDKEVVKHMGLEPYQTSTDVLEENNWYQSIRKEGTGIRWGITLKGKDVVIGSCGFLNMQPRHYRTEIGFELSKLYWGKGIAKEALNAVMSYGYKHFELERIEALIEPLNSASQRLVEKQGFTKEGILRHYEYTCGKFDDLYMYSMLKAEFELG
ncbi:GNAT family N-acetyltransferase [Virgibacillus salexigens]|uniref:GNAT family N-acetyltransferase n=1 Tax=Virgibacillus salexigens TaxID=61016 RepID=UPI001909C994|nr:GNAT family protein [Virgibacillus salexigens]